jgi:hypothetical protein
MSDFTFSDGTMIPKGTVLSVAGRGINQDEARRHTRVILCTSVNFSL